MSEQISDLNLFMMCENPNRLAFSKLEPPYFFDICNKNEVDVWMSLQFDDEELANKNKNYMTFYFNDVYGEKIDEFFTNCLFVRNTLNEPIATSFIWKSYDKINTLHWLKVKKEYEGKGIGRAIISKLFLGLNDDDFPVYLHTQPSSYRAIKLYTDFGFEFITDSVIGTRENHLNECLPILKKYMPKSSYEKLKFTSAPQEFLDAVSSSSINEF